MKEIFIKTIEKSRGKVIVFSLISSIFMWMYVALFPALQGQGDTFKELLESYPEAVIKAFGINPALLFSNLEATLGMYHFSVIFPFIFIAFVVTQAANAISGEIDDKSISVYLSMPISRTKIFLAKYLSGLVVFLIFLAISIFSVIPFALLHNVEYVLNSYILVLVLCFMFGLCVYSLAFMFSAIFSSSGRTNGLLAGITFGMYALFLFSELNDKVGFLKNFSFFYYYDYEATLVGGNLDVNNILLFTVLSVIFTVVGLVYFNKRDIAV